MLWVQPAQPIGVPVVVASTERPVTPSTRHGLLVEQQLLRLPLSEAGGRIGSC